VPLFEPKSWLASKTLWINGLTLAAAALLAVSNSPVLPAEFTPYVVGALAVVNVALRFFTDSPLKSM
jgi:hypothetical protein